MVFSMYDPKLLEGVRTIHFIGCGGSGTYPLIQILHSRGYAITGSDVEETKNTEAERALGVRVSIGHDAANVGNADLVVYSAAIHDDYNQNFHKKDLLFVLLFFSTVVFIITHPQGKVK